MDCSICFEKIENGQEYVNNECCNNTFHNECLSKWYEVKENCPLCRKNNEIIKNNVEKIEMKMNNIFDIIKIMININK